MIDRESDERYVSRLLMWVMGLDEVVGWYSGYLFMGLNLTRRGPRDWLLVVRAQRGKGEQVVSFHTGHRPWAAFYSLAQAIKTDQMGWRPDKFRN